ncbi:MAG TPA: hypothetical protein DCG58_12520 [Hyphomonas adhaerens]|uniref:Copper resistance protein CopB n=2 Tax=Hyphomonadaceae TaxID=69657 RepID=A0A3B9GZV1_9PROT|nr:hypothetical protein [Hyphomonas adhaerens]
MTSMKPIWITAVALFALSPAALAQEGHASHDHGDKPAVEAPADAAKSCMPGQDGSSDCMAGMKEKMADGHMMEHGESAGHEMSGAAMDSKMDHGSMMDHDKMNAEDCQAKHEAMGHNPDDYCPMMPDGKDTAQTE